MNLGLLLFIPYRFMESAVMAKLKTHGHALPLSHARVFQRIGPDGSRMNDLAEAAQVSKQTLTSIVDQLEGQGYVRRSPSPHDARVRLVSITDRGQELIALSQPVVSAIEATWTNHLGRARAAQLRQALTALAEVTNPFASDTDSTNEVTQSRNSKSRGTILRQSLGPSKQ